MRFSHQSKVLFLILTLLSSVTLTNKALALSFNFNQDKFVDDFGDAVDGAFIGEFSFDEADSSITSDNFIDFGELSSFSASYTSSKFGSQTFDLSHLSYFTYDFGSGVLDVSDDGFLEFGAENPSSVDLLTYNTGSQETFVTDFSTFESESSTGNFTLSAKTSSSEEVPEPTTIIGTLLAGGYGIYRKRKSKLA